MHFISGLPRSGSSLLAAILRQNPGFHAAMSGPVCGIVTALLRSMGAAQEYAQFLSPEQRRRIIHSVFDAYYSDLAGKQLIFDTNREWTAHLALLTDLFPQARVVCCLRSPAWILDSFERRVQSSPFLRGKMFPAEAGDNVYSRADFMLKKSVLAAPLQGLRQAWYGEHAHRLIGIRYDSLTENPAAVIGRLYALLGQPPFAHDFEHLEFDEQEFDAQLGMPGLHKVRARIEPNRRATILPPDLFGPNDRAFWDVPGQNPRGVVVL
jgi:sulfotransferase